MRVVSAVFSLVSYCYFFWSLPLVAATGFMINLGHSFPGLLDSMLGAGTTAFLFPYNIDHNPRSDDFNTRLPIDIALLGLFAIPHSVFARPAIKELIGMESFYRSLYVFKSATCLHLLMKFWQPLDDTFVWSTESVYVLVGYGASLTSDRVTLAVTLLLALLGIGWLWLATSTFALDHPALFGLKAGMGIDIMGALGFASADNGLVERAHYTLVRHPIMVRSQCVFYLPVMRGLLGLRKHLIITNAINCILPLELHRLASS